MEALEKLNTFKQNLNFTTALFEFKFDRSFYPVFIDVLVCCSCHMLDLGQSHSK